MAESGKISIPVVENQIYFYLEVTEETACLLNSTLRIVANAQEKEKNPLAIGLHICSPGGSLLHGFSVVDTILSSRIPVHTIVEGYAASAAAKIALAGSHRIITEHGHMLIHQLSSTVWGKYEDQKQQMDANRKFMQMIKKFISKNSKLKEKELEEMLKKDVYFDSKTCLKYGLVDEILVGGKQR